MILMLLILVGMLRTASLRYLGTMNGGLLASYVNDATLTSNIGVVHLHTGKPAKPTVYAYSSNVSRYIQSWLAQCHD